MTCGIYMIQNKVNNKIYIGQAVDIETRWKNHKNALRGNHHHNKHLQRSWNEYGKDNFEFTIICECDESQLNTMEEYYIFELMSYDKNIGYNKNYGGGSGRPTEETKKKLRENNPSHRPEVRKKISEAMKGKRIGGNRNSMYGKHPSEETRKRMSEAKKGKNNPKSIPVVQLTLEGELVKIYDSAREAKRIGFTPESIYKCCKGKRNKHGGYKWIYLHEYDSTIDLSSIKTLNLFEKPCEFTPKRNKYHIPVIQLTLDGELVKVYDAAMEAARNGFDGSHIWSCCRGERKTHKGYKWMYLSDYEAMKKEGAEK